MGMYENFESSCIDFRDFIKNYPCIINSRLEKVVGWFTQNRYGRACQVCIVLVHSNTNNVGSYR
jgi:hypothetical protein